MPEQGERLISNKIESEPKMYSVAFNRYPWSFSDDKQVINPDVVAQAEAEGDSCLPGAIGNWWTRICLESKIEFSPKQLEDLDYAAYCLIEVARNAFEKVGHGEIKVIFERGRVIATISDEGHGFEDPKQQMPFNHGLDHVKKYADEFIIETNGKRFTKIKNEPELAETRDTDIQQGSKITFIKNFE
jgi:hypothetical protein